IDDELVDDDPVKERSLVEVARPVPGMILRRLGLGADPDFRDELLSLTMPIRDYCIRKVDVVGNDQRRDVGQDIRLEEAQIILTVGLDRGIEAQPTIDELRYSTHRQPLYAQLAPALHLYRVRALCHPTHRFQPRVAFHTVEQHRTATQRL